MTDVVAEAITMIEERIADIGEELEKYDALRAEKRDLEKTLAKLRPPAPKPKGEVGAPGTRPDGKPSIKARLILIFEDDPDTEKTVTDVQSELELQGWTTNAADPSNAVRTALENMVRSGEVVRPRDGYYRAG